jgi:hypothetical protein
LRRTAAPEPQPKVDLLLWTAIEQRCLLRLRYQGKERIVEPHDCGIHNGIVKLFTFQVGGASSSKLPDWRWIETDLASDLELLNQTFAGGRPTKSGKHHKWDKLFIRVEPAGALRRGSSQDAGNPAEAKPIAPAAWRSMAAFDKALYCLTGKKGCPG